jgi:DNA-binding CsgD family transcriptional regulator/tetratricopeptide (TPR) repeat protein
VPGILGDDQLEEYVLRTARVRSAEFVGRHDDLAFLDAALHRVEDGAATVLVGGEAGVGKSRLVAEFAAGASATGAAVLSGGCLPMADGSVPYGAVLDLLRGARAREALTALPADVADRLGALMPGSTRSHPSGPHQASDQGRLFDALLTVFERLAADAPLVLVVEDLHWADRSTRNLLVFLTRLLRDNRVLLVATYRTDELAARHPLRATMAELVRAGADRITLESLTLAETGRQLASIHGGPIGDDVVARVFGRSEGNPFLTEELAAAGLVTVGADIAVTLPERLRDLLLVRVRQLPSAAQELLRAVAVAGRPVAHRVLAEVTGRGDDTLRQLLRSAVDLRLLLADGDGYALRHALLTEAVAGDVLPGDRIRLHRAYAEALTRDRRGSVPLDPAALAEIAYHWVGARDPERALAASVEAGFAAARACAPAEARKHFESSIELWAAVGPDLATLIGSAEPFGPELISPEVADLIDLYQHAAEAAYLDGDPAAAITLARRALERLDETAEGLRAGLLHERLGQYLFAGAQPEQDTLASYRAAVCLVPDAATPARARVLSALASILMTAGRYNESRQWCERALDISRRAGARREEAAALSTLGNALIAAGDPDSGIARGWEAVEVARSVGSAEDLHRAYANLSSSLAECGHYEQAAATAFDGLDHDRRHGVAGTLGEFLLGCALDSLFWLGRWAEIRLRLADASRMSRLPVNAVILQLTLVELDTAQGRTASADELLAEVRDGFGSYGLAKKRAWIDLQAAELDLWRGRADRAISTIDCLMETVVEVEDGLLLTRIASVGLRARADLAGTAYRGAGPAAPPPRQLLDRLGGLALTAEAEIHLSMARAELARLVDGSDPAPWAESVEAWRRVRAPYPLAYCQWRQAEALLVRRERHRAVVPLLAEAHDTATRLEALPLLREIEALARRSRIALPSTGPAERAELAEPAQRVGPAVAAHGLTRREAEVLDLLTDGRTNRQIARSLFIAESTVSIHVTRILAKLGAANRVEAAAIAHRLGQAR